MLEQGDLERLAQVGSHLSLGQLASELELIQTVFDTLQGALDAQLVGMLLLSPNAALYYTGYQAPLPQEQVRLEAHLLDILDSLQFADALMVKPVHQPILGRRSWQQAHLDSMIALPLVVEGQIAGLLFATRSPSQQDFSASDLTILAMLCGQLSVTWVVLHLNRQLAAQNQLLQALNQYREEFIRNLSHDLRTPLTCVLGYAELMHQYGDRLNAEQQNEFLEQIVAKSKTLRLLIDNLLDFNNTKNQTVILAQAIDLKACLDQGILDIQLMLSEKSQKLVLDIPAELPWVLGDNLLVVKVLLNLLHNSHKFSPVGGELLLETQVLEGRVRVCVRDNGPGLPTDALERVFEKFRREPNRPISHSAEGIGLGLAVCRDILNALNGRIWAENRLEGTAFCFELKTAGV